MMLIPVFLTVQRSTRRKRSKTRRVCYGDYRARRLDYNEDGKVFVLDPYPAYLQASSQLFRCLCGSNLGSQRLRRVAVDLTGVFTGVFSVSITPKS